METVVSLQAKYCEGRYTLGHTVDQSTKHVCRYARLGNINLLAMSSSQRSVATATDCGGLHAVEIVFPVSTVVGRPESSIKNENLV